MNDHQADKLDRLLKDWAAGERPDDAHLDALGERIWEAAERPEAGAALSPAPASATPPAWPSRLCWFALGAAAAVLVAAVVLPRLPWKPRGDGAPPPVAGVPPGVRLDPRQLASQARLFAAMKEVFAGDLAWVAETDGKVVLGIQPRDWPSPDGGEPITIRLVVMAQGPGETTWDRRFSVDCIVQNEQFVQLGPQRGSQRRVTLWAHRLPDGMIAVDTSLHVETSQPEASSYSGIQRPNVPQQILTLSGGQTEYRVFQTVAVLPKGVG